MISTLEFLELDYNEKQALDFAKNWQPQNTSKDTSSLKTAYYNNDFSLIKETIPDEFALLKKNKKIIKMLTDIGYDLDWINE